jgi:ribonuclease HI
MQHSNHLYKDQKMAKAKYYVVWKGENPGIYSDWDTCRKQVAGFPGAKYKSFRTSEEAKAAFGGGAVSPAESSPSRKKPKPSGSVKKKSVTGVKTYTAGEIAAMAVDTKIFTDGGCEPNPGEAGSGVAVYRDDEISGLWFGLYEPKGTNNTAELNAFKQALIMAQAEIGAEKSVAIFCDSKYSIQCVTQWAAGWEKKGWKKKDGEIKNLELIKEMFALYQELSGDVQVLHVNGHVGVEGNELADRMSMIAIEAKEIDFCLYSDELDIPGILAMRAG